MEIEFTFDQMVFDRCFVLIYPVYSFYQRESLLPVIVDEYLLLEYCAHVFYRFLFVYPVVDFSVGHEYFSCGGGDKQVGLDIAHHGFDKRVEPVID